MTESIGIEPTKTRESGEPLQAGHAGLAFSHWKFDHPEAEDPIAALEALLTVLDTKRQALAELVPNYSLRIALYVSSEDSSNLDVTVPAILLKTMAEIGCSFWVDAYMTVAPGPILEQATLRVKQGMEAEFEAAFRTARWLPLGAEGCHDVQLHRSLESPGTYLLLIEWDSVEAHEVGFRGSEDYEEWSKLLHHFYDPFPTVEHFVEVEWPRTRSR